MSSKNFNSKRQLSSTHHQNRLLESSHLEKCYSSLDASNLILKPTTLREYAKPVNISKSNQYLNYYYRDLDDSENKFLNLYVKKQESSINFTQSVYHNDNNNSTRIGPNNCLKSEPNLNRSFHDLRNRF